MIGLQVVQAQGSGQGNKSSDLRVPAVRYTHTLQSLVTNKPILTVNHFPSRLTGFGTVVLLYIFVDITIECGAE